MDTPQQLLGLGSEVGNPSSCSKKGYSSIPCAVRSRKEDGSEVSKSQRGQTGSCQLLPGLSYHRPHLRASPLISPLRLFPLSPCSSLFLMSGCATNPLELERNPTCCKEMTQIRGFLGAAEILFTLLHVLVVCFFNSSFAQAAPLPHPVLVGRLYPAARGHSHSAAHKVQRLFHRFVPKNRKASSSSKECSQIKVHPCGRG